MVVKVNTVLQTFMMTQNVLPNYNQRIRLDGPPQAQAGNPFVKNQIGGSQEA